MVLLHVVDGGLNKIIHTKHLELLITVTNNKRLQSLSSSLDTYAYVTKLQNFNSQAQ